MRSNFKYLLLATGFALMFLIQNVVLAQELVVKFPEIKGWEKGEFTRYKTPALGYSLEYQSEKGEFAAVYVYNGGLKSIPDDVTHQTIKGEMDRAKGEIHQVSKLGYYQNVKEVKNETITLGGESGQVKALRALFTFTTSGQEVSSEILIWSFQNHFIKIRATRRAQKEIANSKEFTAFLAEMDKLFSKASGDTAIF